jgi:hypothetical protein
MLIQEKIAVAAAVTAAAIYLVRVTLLKYRKRRTEEGPCSGCGCGRTVQLAGRNAQDGRRP